jgi:hypothetical protein
MALTFVKRSTLPAAIKGKAGTLSVGITNNGQIVFSSLATKALNGASKVAMGFDGAKAFVFPQGAKLIAKVEDKDLITVSKSKKTGTISFSGAAILRAARDFGASHTYDFKSSGNQSFPVEVNAKNECLTFVLPEKMEPKPVVARKPRKKLASATVAEVGSTVGTPVQEEELVLETA